MCIVYIICQFLSYLLKVHWCRLSNMSTHSLKLDMSDSDINHTNLPILSPVEFACKWKTCLHVFKAKKQYIQHVKSHLEKINQNQRYYAIGGEIINDIIKYYNLY